MRIEAQGRGTAFGEWGIALIEEGSDIAEDE